MENKAFDLLLSLLTEAVCEPQNEKKEYSTPTDEELSELYKLSKRHDVAHLAAYMLDARGLLSPSSPATPKLQKQHMLAVYRYEQSRYALGVLCDTLQAAQIPHLPLKGAILREHYPKAWMRTSCDLDVFVHREHLQAAIDALTANGAFRFEIIHSHDASLYAANGTHVELHYDLIEENEANQARRLLTDVWSYCTPVAEGSMRYEMNDEMFYFYHVSHMAKHFEIGGCGIRSLLDTWILEHRVPHDREKRDALLSEGALLTFANVTRELADIWFSGGEHNDLTRRTEAYILNGGMYGGLENRVAVEQHRKGGKLRYTLSRIFLPYEKLKFLYPTLQKHKWLCPFYEVRRWIDRIFKKGRLKRSLGELRASGRVSRESVNEMADFLEQVGIGK